MDMLHTHHIIPKHAGGSDAPSNLVNLTIEEHAEAHRVLYEKDGRWQDKCAYLALSGRIGKEEILRTKQGAANKGKKRTPEQCERIRLAALKRNARWKADGTRDKISKKVSETMTGYVKTEEHIKNNHANRNSKHSLETKKKISEGLKRHHNNK